MKVFLSWSEERSRAVATALKVAEDVVARLEEILDTLETEIATRKRGTTR